MSRLVLVLAALAAAAVALPAQLPEPGDLALVLNEDDWDDYLDAWLAIEQQGWTSANITSQTARNNGKSTFTSICTADVCLN